VGSRKDSVNGQADGEDKIGGACRTWGADMPREQGGKRRARNM
jgi:hypothetical protein